MRNNRYLLACARPAVLAQVFFLFSAYCVLAYAFASNDFSLSFVVANSHPTLPLLYRVTAVWGGHEGSILLWVLFLAGWTMWFAQQEQHYRAYALVIAVLGLISVFFLCFLLFTSNPFTLAAPGALPQDLNPLLQDPGFISHPPLLYAGYVGFAVAFAITQAALLSGQTTLAWAQLTRRYALAAWCFLTLGILLGSWWAYRVLGWGGFWFWDPVENASLLPWLCGTGLIHVLIVAEKNAAAKAWCVLLALMCFALSLLGTFLVRSGVLISAHTFAADPGRGLFLLALFASVVLLTLFLYCKKLSDITSTPLAIFPYFSREMSLLLNSVLLCVAMLTILLGTLYPLILDALHLGMISVGAPYFNTVLFPLFLGLMLAMSIAPLLPSHGQQKNWRSVLVILGRNYLLSAIVAALFLLSCMPTFSLLSWCCLSICVAILFSVSQRYRSHLPLFFAHTGFAVLIIGIFLSSLLSIEREVRLRPGNAVMVGPYQFFFVSLHAEQASNFRSMRATFDVNKQQRFITQLFPEKRIYTVRDMVMTKVAIHPGIFRDLYIALGEPLTQGFWSVRIYYKPFVRWIWGGAVLMMLGGICSLTTRRIHRKTA